ncbi:copper resistance protein [Escherichia coli]|nr:copper resistance protein [Escherichia coli]
MFHTIVSIKNDGHYFCRAGGNRPDGLNEPVTVFVWTGFLMFLQPGYMA